MLAVLPPEDVRGLRAEQPRNLALLLIDAVSLLSEYADSAAAAAAAAAAGGGAPPPPPPPPAAAAQALAAARLLTRALPVVLEDPDAPDDFARLVFWRNCLPMPPRKAKKAKKAAEGAADSPSPRKEVYRYEKIDGTDDACVRRRRRRGGARRARECVWVGGCVCVRVLPRPDPLLPQAATRWARSWRAPSSRC